MVVFRPGRVHGMGKFRAAFLKMVAIGVLDVDCDFDIFCLQEVFVPLVQV